MNRTSLAVVLLTTVLAVVQTAPTSEECLHIKIKCKAFEPYECEDHGGRFVRNGGLCGFCDACVRDVGHGANCSIQEVPPRPTPVCRPHLKCGPEGMCRPPKPVKVPPAAETCPGVCSLEYDPVCGSDGITTVPFANKCQYDFHLRCQTKNPQEWKIVPKSQCPKLSTTESPKEDISGDNCPDICLDNYDPVCGSDGNTTIQFPNRCEYDSYLRCKAKNRKEWKIVPKFACQKTKPEEAPIDLEKEHAEQSCPGVCTLDYDPVCGSDGVNKTLFANKCQYDFFLRCTANNYKEWKLISNKDCPDLHRNDSDFAGVDRVGGTCPGMCTLEYNPVCGSDDKILIAFANICQYEYHLRCQVNNPRDWKLVPLSLCIEPASNDSGNDPANSCPGGCSFEYNTVCGSDGNTTTLFPNQCMYDAYLRCEAKNPKEWKLLPNSACLASVPSNDSKKNSSDSCPGICYLEENPVCGTDGKSTISFANLCLYQSHLRCAVKNPLEWKLIRNTDCQKIASNEVGKVDITVEMSVSEPCPAICSLGYVPVCGSDGNTTQTFPNKCHYDHHVRCVVDNKKDWKLVSNSSCQKPDSTEDRIHISSEEQSRNESCPGVCILEYKPICASDGKDVVGFSNKCEYDYHLRCKAHNPKDWKIVPNIDCLKPQSNGPEKNNSSEAQSAGDNCPGMCTMEFDPLCGSDGNTIMAFPNRCQYESHLRCKVKNAQEWHTVPNSICQKNTDIGNRFAEGKEESCPGLCTLELAPVCGSDGKITVLFGNKCQYEKHLRCQATNPQNWKILPNSACIKEICTEAPKISPSTTSPTTKIQRHDPNNRVR